VVKREGFKQWLIEEKELKESTASSRVSNVSRINKEYDLDKQYASDRLIGLSALFDNAIREAKDGLDPNIDIEICGDYCTGLSTLRNALLLYIEYMKICSESESKSSYERVNEEVSVAQVIQADKNSEEGPFFIGNMKAFKTYVAAGYRNKVNSWAKNERERQHGICECCGRKRELQSAHREGMEFKDIIVKILDSKYKIKDNLYKVALDDFENEFREAHEPIQEIFFFLCVECHNKYDKSKEITTEQLENIRAARRYT